MEKKKKDRFDLTTTRGRIFAWLYAFVIEHNFTNLFWRNFHKISEKAYRSSQPTMRQLGKIVKKYSIKTVINLRGNNRNSAYFLLEREKCEKLGVTMVNHTIFSRQMPDLNVVLDTKKMLERAEHPVLIHCKAGCDRVGIISTLYQYFIEKQPMEASIKQLDFWRYGHFRYAKTGKMDFFFDEFIKYNKEHPNRKKDLVSWCETIMDKDDLDRRFVKYPWADFLVDHVLRRQ